MTGAPLLQPTCAGCGQHVHAGEEVCGGCGTPTAQAQRRVVTILFADLSGYTALCHDRDPEEVHLLVRPLMNALRRVCEAHGAMVPSIEGDGFMAAFGARVASEDDPTQALSAAIEMQQLVRARAVVVPELPGLHIGVHLGEVVVAPTWEDVGLSLSGDAVNVASRLCDRAGSGEVLASSEVARLSRFGDGWADAAPFHLRGRMEPVTASAYAWADGGAELRSPRWGGASPYVRRSSVEQELATALARGENVVLVGEAGVGKSRIVAEGVPRGASRVSCAGSRHPSARELLADLIGQRTDAPEGLLARVRHSGGELPQDDDEQGLLEAAGAALTGQVVVEDAERLPSEEVQRLAVALGASTAQWILVSRVRLALPVTSILVPPMQREEAEALLHALLPGASNELQQAVLMRAGDSPLYLEQCVGLLLETGAVTVTAAGSQLVAPHKLREVPTSMRLFVSSRLDLLTPDQREVIGIAAVLGDLPDTALLSHLVGDRDDAVDELVDRGLLRWNPTGAAPQLAFAHALVRDVAYETLLRQRRGEIHRAAAEWYAVLPVSHVLEAQAFHLEQSVDLGAADCDLVRRAVEAMILFARSIQYERTRVAREVLQRTRALIDQRPECDVERVRLELSWASVLHDTGERPEARVAALSALTLAYAADDPIAQAEAHAILGRVMGLDPEADEQFALAAALFEDAGDLAGLARVAVERAHVASVDRGLAAYVLELGRAYEVAQRSGDRRLQAQCAQQLALHHSIISGHVEFELWAERARQASRADDIGLAPRLDLSQAALAMLGLDPASGLEASRRALVAGRELGLRHVHQNALQTRLGLLLQAGEWEQFEETLSEARLSFGRRQSRWLDLMVNLQEAHARQRQGDLPRSLELLDAVAQSELMEHRVLQRDLAEARAWCLLERGDFAQAGEQAAQAVLHDLESAERTSALRPRLIGIVAACAAGRPLALGDIAALRSDARESGLLVVADLSARWLLVEELTQGWSVDLYGLRPSGDVAELQALDLEIEALRSRDWSRLLRAADVWGRIGVTIWRCRALLWHTELTGSDHPSAHADLVTLGAPTDVAELLRAQVRGLRSLAG